MLKQMLQLGLIEFFANLCGRIADFIHCSPNVFARYIELAGPTFDLLGIVHMDLRTVAMLLLRKSTHSLGSAA